MKNNKFKTVALTGIIAGFVLCTNGLSAWQKSAMNDCKKEMDDCKNEASQCTDDRATCKKQAEQCKKDFEDCKKNVDQADAASFSAALTPYYGTQFQQFTADQRKKAMNYADGNKMSPDDAVSKVMKETKGNNNNNNNNNNKKNNNNY